MRALGTSRTSVATGGILGANWARDPLWKNARAAPSLDLRFAENKSLTDAKTGASLVTFTRASTGTFVGSDGVIKSAVTNLSLRSQELGDAAWTKTLSSITADATIAPNGTTTADKLVEDSSTGTHSIAEAAAITYTSGLAYTFSFFIKKAERQTVQILTHPNPFPGTLAQRTAIFNSNTGGFVSVGSAYTGSSVTVFSDGWYRVSVSSTSDATATGNFTITLCSDDIGTSSYTGNGTSGLFLWGAQLEQSSTAGEYIPTTSTINSAPRFDHNPTTGESLGLLVEEARTNLVTWSQDFSQTDWTKASSTIVATAVASPIQGVNYQKIEATSANTTVGITSAAVTAATQQRAVSFFAQPLGNISRLLVVVQGADARININLVDGTFTTNATATGSTVSVSGQRFSVSTPTLTLATGVRFFLKRTGETDTNTTATIAIGEGLYLTGAQMEAGAFPTSYIPTTTATVTRAADVASITGTAFSSWYRQDEGTNLIEFQETDRTGSRTPRSLSDGTATNRIDAFLSSSLTVNNRLVLAGVSYNPGNLTLSAAGTVNKHVFSVAPGSAIAVINGTLSTASAPPSLPVVNRIVIGADSVGGTPFTGTIKRLTYWGTRLPNPTLQAITQP
jgi:hypothetical protein